MKARIPKNFGGMPNNMQSMIQQAQKMQEQMEAVSAGLEEKEYDYQALIREIDAKATPEMLADICRDCCWFPISACCKNICEGKYVK